MNKRLVYALAAIATVAACGGSDTSTPAGLCDKAVSVSSSLGSKIAPCGLTPGDTGIPTNAQTCQTAIAPCSSADLAILNTFLDCANGLPTCTDSTFQTKSAACSQPMSGLSAACQAGIGFTP